MGLDEEPPAGDAALMASINANLESRLVFGAMTGTSLDGLDLAAVLIEQRGLAMRAEIIANRSCALDGAADLRRLAAGEPFTAQAIARMAHNLGTTHAREIASFSRELQRSPDLLAVHGQTIYHAEGLNWTLLDLAPLMTSVDCPIFSQPRLHDMATLGTGAPITPLADWVLLRGDRARVVVNLGGFCNATILPANCAPNDVRAFDVCACNQLLDEASRRWLNEPFDRDGAAGVRGAIDAERASAITNKLATQTNHAAAKSLGTGDEHFSLLTSLEALPNVDDRIATLVASIGAAIRARIADHGNAEWLLFGGGAHNLGLRRALEVDAIGTSTLACDVREAAAMAVLGALAFDGVSITLDAVTGRTNAPKHLDGQWTMPIHAIPMARDTQARALRQ